MGEVRSINAMTPAERKAKSRAMMLGGIAGHLEAAEDALQLLRHETIRATPEMQQALDLVQLHLDQARGLLPKARGV